jgi:hypothetical protein
VPLRVDLFLGAGRVADHLCSLAWDGEPRGGLRWLPGS